MKVKISGWNNRKSSLLLQLRDGASILMEKTIEGDNCKDMEGWISCKIKLATARLWTPDEPNLYTLGIELMCENRIVQAEVSRVGFRTCLVDVLPDVKEKGPLATQTCSKQQIAIGV